MRQKISALFYIKNNKKRVLVLVVSLAMFFVVCYLTKFLLETTTETFRVMLVDNAEGVEYISFGAQDLDIDYEEEKVKEPTQIYMEAVAKKIEATRSILEAQEGIERVYLAQIEYVTVNALVGNFFMEMPTFSSKEQVVEVLKLRNAELLEGRLPENENEILLDQNLCANQKFAIGDMIGEEKEYEIVGMIDCPYFSLGISGKEIYMNPMACLVTSEPIEDLQETLQKAGINLEGSSFIDLKYGRKVQKEEVEDMIESSTSLVFYGIMIIVSLLVTIVYITYIRDRRSEWCIYASIGYSRKTIFGSILRELLFTFGVALGAGIILTVLGMLMIDGFVIKPNGLQCGFLLEKDFLDICAAFIALFGFLMIPIQVAMNRIKTIDAIDDDI